MFSSLAEILWFIGSTLDPSPWQNFTLMLNISQSCIHDLTSSWQPPGSKDMVEYFTLGDLWDCYDEWSAYGSGTQVLLNKGESVMQYYVPYLSAIQIYSNKAALAFRSLCFLMFYLPKIDSFVASLLDRFLEVIFNWSAFHLAGIWIQENTLMQ